MFLQLDQKNPDKVAVIDDSGLSLTYGNLCNYADELKKALPHRTLVFILAENRIGSLVGYTSFLNNRVVPLVLSNNTEKSLFDNLFEAYKPEFLWLPENRAGEFSSENPVYSVFGYALVKTGNPTPQMYEDLSLLLPTSGSTGSPKLVRHCYRNIEANAENVMNLFGLTPSERAMASLPMHYTMGLSVISSHLFAGATILLCGKSLLEIGFWKMLKDAATSFTGVPYSYELLSKLRFFRMDLPDLKIITQGGGKLTIEMWQQLAQYAQDKGKKFIATYGQCECTARMAYLPAELALSKPCSIGIAEPGGQLSLINNDGVETFEGEDSGEMIYRGENVTLGYANSIEDLLKGDENHGIMHTGDLAQRDADGCYYIIGRLKRFLKIFGLRIGLDEVENIIRSTYETDVYCSGNDEELIVKVTNSKIVEEIPAFIENKTHLFHQRIKIVLVDKILRNEAGKVINQ
ncbi:o-succinylbenzoate--CoA ligase [Butyricimonas virosa]|uniref:O-succinylbenzoate--CoA ligase n=1 Tax=Butyricimonas virosa TaxID=544645 RepID=A0A412WXD9_9BACT|nr:AMP-binding protein [Butyricimonas virosa]RGV32166.1 o-succinylbenzoate--CoA ligase [Butyricimonas virosa]